MAHKFANQTHPTMNWEQSKIGEDSCLTTTYISGAIAQVRIIRPYRYAEIVDCNVEVLFRDGSEYTWQNK